MNAPPAPPKEIAKFEIVRRLGAGGMAEVFLAKKRGAEGTYKVLVLKRILPTHGGSRRFRSMFIEEAHLATRLNHPNVVQVYEFQDFGDEGLLLAMEYVEGCDLGRLMSAAKSKSTTIPPWVGAWIIAEAAKGLHYAHEKKDEAGQPLEIVHRDVSPQNVLLSFEGAVKIADFGIASARLFAEEQGVLKGKFGYMSPEQARGESLDRRSDLYALGVILWEILAGRPIHGGLGGEALLDIVRSGIVEPPATYAPEIPPELEEIVLKALSPERNERYGTCRELAAALGKAIVARGELIDAAALESALAELTRGTESEPPPPPSEASDEPARTQAAVPLARSLPGSRSSGIPDSFLPPRPSGLGAEGALPSEVLLDAHGPREVRHVAGLMLRLHGLAELALPRRTLDQLRGMLDDLAFKRGMRWVWTEEARAHAIAGVGANSSRAAADAAQLALDVHEAISGFVDAKASPVVDAKASPVVDAKASPVVDAKASPVVDAKASPREDLPGRVAASIGIVRGIATGTRDAQGHLVAYSLHNPTEYLADVLERATPMGRTWVAGGVYRLVRRDFRWGDAPTLKLEAAPNLDVPPMMRVYALERSLSREERLAEAQAGASDLVGRDAEKADLHAAFHESVSGGAWSAGQLVCRAVVGEMGIGKTALVATFLAEMAPHARLLHVECTPVTMEVPYAAVADLVRSAIGTTGKEPFEEVVSLIARAGGAARGDPSSPVVTRLAELATNQLVGGDEDAYARKKNVLSGLRNLMASMALIQPVVLVVEGMHWGDKTSLDVIGEIAHGVEPLPILVLLVTRHDDRVLNVLEGVMRVELRGLMPDEQVRLVETRLGVRDGARQVCADLLPKVGGNPFFLLEMIDALLERGALEIREVERDGERISVLARTDRGDGGFGALPSTLEQLLGDRIRELPAEEHAVVDWLAVAGGPLPVNDLVKLAGRPDDEAIVRLCARGLCDRKGELVDFRHPLTRDVAYAALEPGDRLRMHGALGDHLAGTPVARGLSAAIVARHLARSEAPDRAADFYLEAADAARNSHQTPLALRYYQRALALLGPEDPRRIHGHEALESAYRMLGRRRERIHHLEALRRLVRRAATPRPVCLGLLRSARYDFDEGHLARGVVVARQAAEVAHASKISALEVEAEALITDFLRELGDVQGALAACDRALAAFDFASGTAGNVPPRLQGDVLRSRGVLLRRVGRVREAVDAYVDAIAIFKKSGARRMEARAKNALAYAMFVQGRYEDAIALALESIQIDLSIGGRFQIANTLTNVGHSYFRLGDTARALAYLKRAREAHDRYADQHGWAETLLVSALIATELGNYEAAEGFLADAGALTAVTGNAYDRTHESVARAQLARARRQPNEAVHHALAARHGAENMALVAFHFFAMAIEAAARVDLGEMHTATLLATTALGAVENLQGSEYGLEVRSLCADALKRAGSPQAPGAHQRAVDYANALMRTVRDARLRKLSPNRPLNAALFETTPVPFSAFAASVNPSAESTREDASPLKSTREDASPLKSTREDASPLKSTREDASPLKSTREELKERQAPASRPAATSGAPEPA